jgi:mono/diheme cytochrome c family protein
MKTKVSVSSVVLVLASLLADGCSDKASNPMSADQQPVPPPTTSSGVSFQTDIKPIFQTHGCASCHGGNGGLFVGSVAQLLQGGSHGPAIVPGNADASNIVKKLSPNPPFGDRMPFGGPYLPDSTIQLIRTWINQGAKDN